MCGDDVSFQLACLFVMLPVNLEATETQRQVDKDPTRIANTISIAPPVYVIYHSSSKRYRRFGWRASDPRQIAGASTGIVSSRQGRYQSAQIMTGLSKKNYFPHKYRTPMERLTEAITNGMLAAARQHAARARGAGVGAAAAAVVGAGQAPAAAGPGAGAVMP